MVREGSRATATALVLGGIVSVQVGAAFATTLFDEVGPGGTVFLRIAFAALLLLAIWRPPLRLPAGAARRDVVLLGVVLAGMNLSFYLRSTGSRWGSRSRSNSSARWGSRSRARGVASICSGSRSRRRD